LSSSLSILTRRVAMKANESTSVLLSESMVVMAVN